MAKSVNVKTVSISADTLTAILSRLDQQGAALTSLVDTKASVKPAVPAKAPKPALSIEAYAGKHGPALLLKVNGAKWGVMLYRETYELMKAHAADIEAAFKKLPK
jgi:hypothetical protein